MSDSNNNINSCCSSSCMPCGCVGYAYVPSQILEQVYDPAQGLNQGTIFPELDLTINEYGKVCKQPGGVNNGKCQ